MAVTDIPPLVEHYRVPPSEATARARRHGFSVVRSYQTLKDFEIVEDVEDYPSLSTHAAERRSSDPIAVSLTRSLRVLDLIGGAIDLAGLPTPPIVVGHKSQKVPSCQQGQGFMQIGCKVDDPNSLWPYVIDFKVNTGEYQHAQEVVGEDTLKFLGARAQELTWEIINQEQGSDYWVG